MPIDMPPVNTDSVAAAIEKEKEGAKIEYVQQKDQSSEDVLNNLMKEHGMTFAPKMKTHDVQQQYEQETGQTLEQLNKKNAEINAANLEHNKKVRGDQGVQVAQGEE
jgi:hypothetical protein